MDQLDVLDSDLEVARADLAKSERADLDGRVADAGQHRQAVERKRMRVRELEELRDEMVAAEEAQAEAEHGDGSEASP